MLIAPSWAISILKETFWLLSHYNGMIGRHIAGRQLETQPATGHQAGGYYKLPSVFIKSPLLRAGRLPIIPAQCSTCSLLIYFTSAVPGWLSDGVTYAMHGKNRGRFWKSNSSTSSLFMRGFIPEPGNKRYSSNSHVLYSTISVNSFIAVPLFTFYRGASPNEYGAYKIFW